MVSYNKSQFIHVFILYRLLKGQNKHEKQTEKIYIDTA